MAINQRRSSGTATLTGAHTNSGEVFNSFFCNFFLFISLSNKNIGVNLKSTFKIIWVIMCSTALLNKHNKTYVSQENNKNLHDNK